MDAPLSADGPPRPMQRFGVSEDAVWHCAVSPDGSRAIALAKEVKIHDLASGEATVLHPNAAIVGMAPASQDGVLAWSEREIFVWGWERPMMPLQFPSNEPVVLATLLPESNGQFASITRSPSGESMHLLGPHQSEASVRLEEGTRWLSGLGMESMARGLRSGAVEIWHYSAGSFLGQPDSLPGQPGPILRGRASSDGVSLATAARDLSITVWSQLPRFGMQHRATLAGHTDEITGLAFTPDGRKLISCSRDRTIRVWSIPDGTLLKAFTDHRDWVTHVAVNPAGTRLASCSDDGTIRLWDLEALTLLGTAYGSSRFLSLAMSDAAICAGDASGAFWILEYGDAPAAPSELARRYLVSGRVAGVFFRQFVRDQATTLGVRGDVRNLPDGRIAVHVVGTPEQHAAMKAALSKGPAQAQVAAVEEEIVALTDVQGFSVR